MSNKDARSSLRSKGVNPSGDVENEIREGVGKINDCKDSMESLTVTAGCGTLWTIFCC